jgi:hypothetical protein
MTHQMFVTGVRGLVSVALICVQGGCRRDRPTATRPAAATLEFRILAERDPAKPEQTASRNPEHGRSAQEYFDLLKLEGPTTRPSGPYRWFKIADPDAQSFPDPPYVVAEHGGARYVLVHDTPDMGLLRTRQGWWVQTVVPGRDRMNRPAIDFRLGGSGPTLFAELTGNNIGRRLAILVDNEVISAANIMDTIYDSGQITGQFTDQYVADLVNKLSTGE